MIKETSDAVIAWVQVDPQLARNMIMSNFQTSGNLEQWQGFADMPLDQGMIAKRVEMRSMLYDTYFNPPR